MTYKTFDECMNQENFINCPIKIYKDNIESYTGITKYLISKQLTSECGKMVGNFYIINITFFWPDDRATLKQVDNFKMEMLKGINLKTSF